MRRSWHPQLTSGADYLDFHSLDKPEREKIDWGVGGLAIGLFVGLLAGSKLTFHSPVRRRIR